MSDLISRDELGAAIDNWLTIDRYYHPYSKQKTIPVSEVIDIIKLLPTAETEIVKCRECRHWDASKNCDYCDIWDHYISNEAFYCGCGERRQDG